MDATCQVKRSGAADVAILPTITIQRLYSHAMEANGAPILGTPWRNVLTAFHWAERPMEPNPFQ